MGDSSFGVAIVSVLNACRFFFENNHIHGARTVYDAIAIVRHYQRSGEVPTAMCMLA